MNQDLVKLSIYEEVFTEITAKWEKKKVEEFELLIKTTKSKLKDSNILNVKNVLNYYDIDQIECTTFSLLDLIIFSILSKTEIIFKGIYSYLNRDFNLVCDDNNVEDSVFVNSKNFKWYRSEEPLIMLVYTALEDKIVKLFEIIYFICPLTHLDTVMKSNKTVIKGMTNNLTSNTKNRNFDIYSTKDIDGLLGAVEGRTLTEGIKANFNLNIYYSDKKSRFRVFSKNYNLYFENDLISVSSCYFKSLGYFDCSLGKLNLFILYPKNEENIFKIEPLLRNFLNKIKSSQEFKKDRISTTCSLHINLDKEKEIATGVLANEYQKCFFDFMECELKQELNFFFFVELLGNKNSTRLTTEEELLRFAQINLDFSKLDGILIDICSENFVSSNHLISPKSAIFEKFKVKPNYNLLFCPDINNCLYKNLYNKVEDAKIANCTWKYGFINKLNFYSSIEDVTKPARDINFLPEFTIKNFENFIKNDHGRTLSLENDLKKLKSMEEVRIDETITYRKELRIQPRFIIDGFKLLEDNNIENYNLIPSELVTNAINKITYEYIEMYNMPLTIDNFFLFEIMEIVYKKWFLSGERNCHKIFKPIRNSLLGFFVGKDFIRNPLVISFYNCITLNGISFEDKCKSINETFIFKYRYKENCLFADLLKIDTYEEGLKLLVNQIVKCVENKRKHFDVDLTTIISKKEISPNEIAFEDIYVHVFREGLYGKDPIFNSTFRYLNFRFNENDPRTEREMFKVGLKLNNLILFYPINKYIKYKLCMVIQFDSEHLYIKRLNYVNGLIDNSNFVKKSRSSYSELDIIFFYWLREYKMQKNCYDIQKLDLKFFLGIVLRCFNSKHSEVISYYKNKMANFSAMCAIAFFDPELLSSEFKISEVKRSYTNFIENFEIERGYSDLHDMEREYYKKPDKYAIFLRLSKGFDIKLENFSSQILEDLVDKYPKRYFKDTKLILSIEIPFSEIVKYCPKAVPLNTVQSRKNTPTYNDETLSAHRRIKKDDEENKICHEPNDDDYYDLSDYGNWNDEIENGQVKENKLVSRIVERAFLINYMSNLLENDPINDCGDGILKSSLGLIMNKVNNIIVEDFMSKLRSLIENLNFLNKNEILEENINLLIRDNSRSLIIPNKLISEMKSLKENTSLLSSSSHEINSEIKSIKNNVNFVKRRKLNSTIKGLEEN